VIVAANNVGDWFAREDLNPELHLIDETTEPATPLATDHGLRGEPLRQGPPVRVHGGRASYAWTLSGHELTEAAQ
jgi:hypothetical protein